MSESDSIPKVDPTETQITFNRESSALRGLHERLQTFVPSRWIFLLTGIACIVYSQYLMETRAPIGELHSITEIWNAKYRLAIVNFNNVLSAAPYLLIGATLCALTAFPSAWKKSSINWATHWPTRAQAQWKTHLPRLILGIGLMTFLLFQLGRHQYAPVYPIFWLIAIIAFTHLFRRWDKNAGNDLALGVTAQDLFWVAGLLTLGFGIASFALQDIPIHLVPDEGSFWETTRAIATKEFHPVFFDSGVYTFPVASSIFQGLVARWFGVNLWGWRFSSVIAGVLTIVPLYFLTREWFDRKTAVVVGILLIANPYFLSFTRLGYNNSQALFPVTLAIYFFAVALRKGSYFYLWLAGLAAGLGFYTYSAAWLGLLVVCLTILYLLIIKQFSWKQAFITLFIVLAGWIVVFGPRLAYTTSGDLKEGLIFKIFETSFISPFYGRDFYSEAELTRTSPIIHVGKDSSFFYDPRIYSELLIRAVVRTFVALFNPHIIHEHFLSSGLTGVVTPIFFVIGLVLSLTKMKQAHFGILVIWLSSGLIFLSIVGSFPPRHTHLVSVIPALALLSGIGLSAVAESLSEQLSVKSDVLGSAFKTILILFACAIILYYGFQRYFVKLPLLYPSSFEDVASWITWRTTTPTQIIYLGQSDIPHRVEYLVRAKIGPHTYKTAVVNEFALQSELITNGPTVIFVESTGDQEISLLQKPPTGFHDSIAYRDHNGNVIGYALTNMEIDLQPKAGTEDGINSLLNTPVRNVLLSLMIVLALAGTLLLRQSHGWPREEILFEVGSLAEDLESEKFEKFEFHLRIRIPPHKQKPS